ncbi:tRNA pseudouridine(38-40) synthase TruA [bacterium]|nr:tRNA pseudouridine(38-40) synthase TruA [bacterium]
MTEALPTRRVALIVEYDGTDFRGLQRQPHDEETIQGKIEAAVQRLGAGDVGFVASGRTDAGVHALGQVVAVSIPERLETRRVALALNALLPEDIRIRQVADCPPDFSPRFDAIRRTYHYHFTAMAFPTPLERRFVSRIAMPLDTDLIGPAAESFKGQWELREWRSSICQATRTFLNIDEAEATPPTREHGPWRIRFAARSFLHHQVRFMVGGIIAVASGKLTVAELREALAAGVRPKVVAMQSACGLCLAQVDLLRDKDPFAAASDATPRSVT